MARKEERIPVTLENEGQKIFGILHRPSDLMKCPAVLICHGLAGHKTGRYRIYVHLAEKLSEVGIAVLRIDFRGSGDSEGNFSDMTIESEVSDALLSLKFLETFPTVDKTRIGLFGRSIGGMVALLTARRYGQIKSLATWAPLFDGMQWEEQWHQLQAPHVSEEIRMMRMRVNGQVPGPPFFKQLFAVRMSDELNALADIPFLNIHGEKDEIVALEHAHKFQKQREKAVAESKFLRLANSDHDFSDPYEQKLAINETTEWFSNTL